jgi:hypothetical protein
VPTLLRPSKNGFGGSGGGNSKPEVKGSSIDPIISGAGFGIGVGPGEGKIEDGAEGSNPGGNGLLGIIWSGVAFFTISKTDWSP